MSDVCEFTETSSLLLLIFLNWNFVREALLTGQHSSEFFHYKKQEERGEFLMEELIDIAICMSAGFEQIQLAE